MQTLTNLATSLSAFLTTLGIDILTWAPRIVLALLVMLLFLWLARWLERSAARLFQGRDLTASTQLFFQGITHLTTIGAEVMNRCRAVLLTGGYTVSANCTTNWVLSGDTSMEPVHVVGDPVGPGSEAAAAVG